MLKKMRWRFIWSAMIAVLTVMLVLTAAINLIYYYAVTTRQDRTLSALMELETSGALGSGAVYSGGWLGSSSPETQYSTRFFSVYCDDDGNVIFVRRDYIASVSEAEAEEFAQKVLAKGNSSGYSGDYRYAVERGTGGSCIVFLNSASELQLMRYVLLISCAVAVATFLLIFVLVILLSKRAIMPYVKNLEMQRQFITDAGHEIKTPLTSISTSADVLAGEYEDDEWIKNIQKQTMRLSKLVNNLVALSRLDEATPFPEKSSFSLSEAAWETAEPFSSAAKARGKQYSQSIEEDLVINGDKNAVQQMMSVLLDNAVKYSDDGGEIRFSVSQKRKNCVIEVYNTCEPVSAEDVSHLFDRFYRPDRSRSTNTGGTGIGLSIAKATAEGHGGKISVRCPTERSICFTVVL